MPPQQRDPDGWRRLIPWIQTIFVVVCIGLLGVLLAKWQIPTLFVYYRIPSSNITFVNMPNTNSPDSINPDDMTSAASSIQNTFGKTWQAFVDKLSYMRIPIDTSVPTKANWDYAPIVRAKMNISANPCDDFYNYACGKYEKEPFLFFGKPIINAFTVLDDVRHRQLVSLLQEKVDEKRTTPFKLPKHLYQLCMHKPKINQQGIGPMVKILDSLGGWPLLKGDDWNKDSSLSWESLLRHLSTLGYSTNYLFDVSVRVDMKNPSRRIIYIDQPTLSIKHEYLAEGGRKARTYLHYSMQMAWEFRARTESAERELNQSVVFEVALAKISKPYEERLSTTVQNDPVLVKDLQRNYNYMNWLDFFNAIFQGSDVVINENEPVIVQEPEYMKKLGELLPMFDGRTVVNYIIRRVINFSTSFLPEALQKVQLNYSAQLCHDHDQEHPCLDMTTESMPVSRHARDHYTKKNFQYYVGNPSFPKREKVKLRYSDFAIASNEQEQRCLDLTENRLPIAVGALYIRRYFKPDIRSAALDMANNIKTAFGTILEELVWMDEVTRTSALEKLDAMVLHIGYPDKLMSNYQVNRYYEDLKYNSNSDYLDIILNIDRFTATKNFQKLRQVVDKTDWTTHSSQGAVDAFYNPTENSIYFPASYFQGELFSMDQPRYMNYGAIGTLIGREMTRGFYFNTSDRHVDWWPTKTSKDAGKIADCLINQYGKYEVPGSSLKVNGKDTLVENIADQGGIKAAYYAYRVTEWDRNPEVMLPGIELEYPVQMFWLSAAQTWFTVYNKNNPIWTIIASSDIPPARTRVLEAMRNIRDFSFDFNCPSGSPMDPAKKCQFWLEERPSPWTVDRRTL